MHLLAGDNVRERPVILTIIILRRTARDYYTARELYYYTKIIPCNGKKRKEERVAINVFVKNRIIGDFFFPLATTQQRTGLK